MQAPPVHPIASKVVIVGGGIAGLATAYELHTRRIPFTLLEAQPRAGGVILSEAVDRGFVVDAGPDSLLVQKPDGIALCRDLGLGDRLISVLPPRTAFVQRGQRLFPLPADSVLGFPTAFRPFVATTLFSWPGKLRMGSELFLPARRENGDESVGAFMRRRFGEEATTYLAEPLLAGIHAGDVDRLSLGALFPRFHEAERTRGSVLRSFRRAARTRRPTRAKAGAGDESEGAFRSLPGGLSELIQALMRALPADSVQLGVAASRVVADRSQFRVETEIGGQLAAPAVVLASPAFVTARLVQALSPRLHTLCAAIPYASTATIALAFPRQAVGHPLTGTGFVVPKVEGTGILAASWLSSKWAHRAPAGHVLMRAFIGGARDPGALDHTDAALTDRVLVALRPLLSISGAPLWTRLYRWPRANAQHEVGHQARVAEIERELSNYPGLFVTGSAYRGVGIPDCVADGRATARHLAAWLATRATP